MDWSRVYDKKKRVKMKVSISPFDSMGSVIHLNVQWNTNNGDGSFKLMGVTFKKGDDGVVYSSRQPFDKGDENSISVQRTESMGLTGATSSGGESSTVSNVARFSNNNFPANVKKLLSTGIFDGVPIWYHSYKRDAKLHGVVEGNGFKCSCKECELRKPLNANEFEQHAGSHSYYPIKYIYFQNGKSVYEVAKKLRNTPKEMLFEAIQEITGSPINQQNFRIWKESFLAANRELRRIHGHDEVV